MLLAAATAALLLDGELLAAPNVPDGLLLKAMYPNSPAEDEPHLSDGNPGQSSLQELVDVVTAGI